ncbi:MAG: hypothetical protein JO040_03610 [Gemmatimonadetes bacterium]|nr:hypothetical protein [Gemmatimonadota bacterium]
MAMAMLQEQRHLGVEDLGRGIVTSHPKQEWHPTIPSRVTREDLSELRSGSLGLAVKHGFPEAQPRGGHTKFDQQLAVYLYGQMNLVPAEAAVGGMWSFMSLVLLPDIAAWRYPDRHRQRFIGSDTMIGTSNRHVFCRLWARAYVFGPNLLVRLVEDNFEGLWGRPNIGGNVRLARAIAATMVRIDTERKVTNSQELLREALKRIRRLAYIISFNGLEGDELRDLLYDVFTASADALQRQIY